MAKKKRTAHPVRVAKPAAKPRTQLPERDQKTLGTLEQLADGVVTAADRRA